MISVILSLLTFGFLGAKNIKEGVTFSEEAWVFRGCDSQLVVEAMMPDFGHIVPVVNDTVLDWVVQLEDTLFGLGLLSDVDVLVVHSDHDVVVLWSSDNGWER